MFRGPVSCTQLKLKWMVPGLLVLAALPGSVQGAWLGFRNDTKRPVIVQGMCIANKIPCRTRPHLLYPGEVSWDAFVQAGNKVITIYDAKNTSRVLYQGTIQCIGDSFLSIQSEAGGKARLVPARATTPPTRQMPR